MPNKISASLFPAALLASAALAADYKLGDGIAVQDVTYKDPHRGATLMKDATLTFESVEEHASVKNQLLTTDSHEIKANGKFVVVLYNAKNNAALKLDIYALFFGGCSLVDDTGATYPISKVSGQFAQAMGRDMQGKRIEQGETMRSCIAFEIPEGAEPKSLKLDLIGAMVSLSGGAPAPAAP
ncbi:MAG: DUF4352 domain-containing protein [Acidobacteriota bacterium]